MAADPRKLERALAELAGRQHGAVARRQLLALGFTRHSIARRIATGVLTPVHRGVYRVGWAAAPLGRASAALLACGPGAFLSHLTSARLLALPVPDAGAIDVTVVGRWRRALEGVRVHSITDLLPDELRRHRGLPIAAPQLTILDLAGRLPERGLRAALNEARVLRIVTDRQLRATLAAHPKRRGARALRALLESERDPRITRSEAERRALAVMRRHGIEPDATDHRIGLFRVDFWFARERLAVEVDGYRYHSTPERFRDDRRRTAYLAARGIQVFPLTWHDTGSGTATAMERLAATLAIRRQRGAG